MIPTVIEIGSPNLYLSKTRGFLSVKDKENKVSKVPLDDIGVLLITSPKATLSTSLINTLSERGIVALICNNKHRPASYLYPYQSHMELTGRLLDQIAAGKPLKKRIWQSLVQSKIFHQAYLLDDIGSCHSQRLKKLGAEVSSGDKENREAQAARIYWQAAFGDEFRRTPRGDGLNKLLDFGYGIIRSAMLRAIAGTGLNPSLGLSHSSRRNPFCLADDLMEPYRPVIDFAVYRLKDMDPPNLNTSVKAFLAALIAIDVQTNKGNTAVARSMFTMTQSLVRSFETKTNQIQIPMISEKSSKDIDRLWKQADFS